MYFVGYEESLEQRELEETVRAPDVGGDRLSFTHLDDRRFEVLAYRLLHHEQQKTRGRVTLMKGTGDQGRDVIVHSAEGHLTHVIQCKHYNKKFNAPDLRKELIKLAIHSHLRPDVLANGSVTYELWCPAGLTGPATEFLNTWPRTWSADLLVADAAEVIEAYAAFERINWADIGTSVCQAFAKKVAPVHITDLLITEKVKRVVPVYEAYFEGKVVMSRSDALASFDQVSEKLLKGMQDVLQREIGKFTDTDGKNLLERIASFPRDRRHAHLTGYVMGLSPEFVGKFNDDEFDAFAKASINSTMAIISTVMTACARIVFGVAIEFRESVQPRSRTIAPVLVPLLTNSAIARIAGMLLKTRSLMPDLEAFAAMDLKERLRWSANELWDSYQRCLAGYQPRRHQHGSNEERRYQVAVSGMDGARSREEFLGRVMQAFDDHEGEVSRRYNAFMNLVPEQLLVVTDTVSAFENSALAERVAETSRAVEQARGAPIV